MPYVVEYDPEYFGGNYAGNSSQTCCIKSEQVARASRRFRDMFLQLPREIRDFLGGDLEAFALKVAFVQETFLQPQNIIHWRWEEAE